MAYTSPSTALYQKESQKVYARAPTTPAAMIVNSCCLVMGPVFLTMILRAKCVIDQNRNKIVKPLASAFIKLTASAGASGRLPNNQPKHTMNILPINTKSGAPGG